MGTVDGGLCVVQMARAFGEGCWELVVRVEIEGQFVVTAAQVLDERMSSTRAERSRLRPRIGRSRDFRRP